MKKFKVKINCHFKYNLIKKSQKSKNLKKQFKIKLLKKEQIIFLNIFVFKEIIMYLHYFNPKSSIKSIHFQNKYK